MFATMPQFNKVSEPRQRDFQTCIQILGGIIMGIGFFMLGTSLSELLAVIWIGFGLGFQLLSRRFDPSRIEIRYGGKLFS